MSTMNRRLEIVDILVVKRSTTANELAQKLGVSVRTVHVECVIMMQYCGKEKKK